MPERLPQLQAVVAAYSSLGDQSFPTCGVAASYSQIKPAGWPPAVHFEFICHSKSSGATAVELHVENRAYRALRPALEQLVDRLRLEFDGIRVDSWQRSLFRVVIVVTDTGPVAIAAAMQRFIGLSHAEISGALKALPTASLKPSNKSAQIPVVSTCSIFHGPPGTGKTRMARQVAARLIGGKAVDVEDGATVSTVLADNPTRFRLVVFHPAYEYDQFIGGLRVKSTGGQLEYSQEPGVLVQIAEAAAADPNRPYVLVIDEINRGNVPRLFGELLYALEYRDEPVQLSFRDAPFAMPSNLYVIGTMNTADRSVDSLDVALRRRFAFYEMKADPGVVRDVWGVDPIGEIAADALEQLNSKLAQATEFSGLAVGPSYFIAPPAKAEQQGDTAEAKRDRFAAKVRHQLLPLLDEYARLAGKTGADPAREWKASLSGLCQELNIALDEP